VKIEEKTVKRKRKGRKIRGAANAVPLAGECYLKVEM